MKKDELERENDLLKAELDQKDSEDLKVRTELSKLLDSFTYEKEYGYSTPKKKVDVCSWLEIAFLIGELKADANYSCLLESREEFRRENDTLRQQIKDLSTPNKE